MNGTNNSAASPTQMLKTNLGGGDVQTTPPPTTSPETMHQLSQQLLCMNSLLNMNNSTNLVNSNANNNNNNPCPPQVFVTKEQIAEQYQIAKMRLNQDLLGASSAAAFYNAFPYTYSPYADASGGGKIGHHHLVSGPNGGAYGSGAQAQRFRYSHHHHHMHEDPKPQHSYIGLIAIAILSMPDQKMVLSDIYQHILDNYPYFRNRGPGWRNSIRHNLSLNDCFIKSGRSANGKGHYWAIHPANLEDFRKGDFRRRKAQRKVRKHMGLSVPDDDEDDDESPLASPLPGSFVPGNGLFAEKAAVAAAAACAAGNLLSSAPNPFVQAISTNPFFNSANPACFSAQAFNFFNSLRFAAAVPAPPAPPGGGGNFHSAPAGPPSNFFNETLYRQLINLNIRQDLQSAVNRSVGVRKGSEFSIESLLSQHPSIEQHHNQYSHLHQHHLLQRTASTDSDVDSEPEAVHCTKSKSHDFQSSEFSMEENMTVPNCEHNTIAEQTKQQHLQPVNLKIN